MANIQIPNLPPVIALNGAELLEGVQSGSSVRITMGQILAAAATGTPTALPVPIAVGGTGATTAPDARTNLGLGTIAVQNASAVVVTGGIINGTTIGGTTAAAGSFTVGTFGLGAVGSPSITFTGDTNTGIWSPAADTVAISTGGSERIRIVSDGRIGVGVSVPASGAFFDVTSTSGGLIIPRMTTVQRDAIASPANGLMIYNTTNAEFEFRANNIWTPVLLSFDTVAALLANTSMTYPSTPTGAIIEAQGFRYTVAASAATDQHVTTAGGVKLYVQPGDSGYNVKAFGAVGNGVADDTAAIQAAANAASAGSNKLLLMQAHAISATISLSGDIEISPIGESTTITASTGVSVFTSTATDAHVRGIKLSGGNALWYQTASFSGIVIDGCDFTGAVNTSALYLFYTNSAALTAERLSIINCTGSDCTPVFCDNLAADIIEVSGCTFDAPTQFFVRCLDQLSAGKTKQFFFRGNTVKNINGNMVAKTNTARMFAVEASDVIFVESNTLNGAESSVAANFIYSVGGSLVCTDNIIKNINTISSISIIDDKGSTTTDGVYWFISGNTFDQTGISQANSPESAIRINEKRNVTVTGNKFVNLKMYACRFYHSVDTGNYPRNCVFAENDVYAHEHPVVVQVFQNILNTVASSNRVYRQTNPLALVINGRAQCRLVDIYQTFSNGQNLDGVVVKGNVVVYTEATGTIAMIYRNASAVTSDIVNVSVVGNQIVTGGEGFVRFVASNMQAPIIADNIGNSGVALNVGSTPPLGIRNWGQSSVSKGTTASRPTPSANDIGLQYLDTTLDADGKPIWWTGTAWVDATGAVV